jgi:hypothetical protein
MMSWSVRNVALFLVNVSRRFLPLGPETASELLDLWAPSLEQYNGGVIEE